EHGLQAHDAQVALYGGAPEGEVSGLRQVGRVIGMSHGWKTTDLASDQEVLDILADLQGKRWLSRGQSRRYCGLVPSIDREPREGFTRHAKLLLERESIDLFRSTARFFAGPGEQGALADDVVALMVLRH